MRLTEQQRDELERRGWTRWSSTHPSYEAWQSPSDGLCSTLIMVSPNGDLFARGFDEFGGEADANVYAAAEFAAVVGIPPKGYRLVSDAVAEKALPLVQALAEQKRVVAEELIGAEERAEAFEEYRALMALASALQGEVEKRG